jgi:hypothetical protein
MCIGGYELADIVGLSVFGRRERARATEVSVG